MFCRETLLILKYSCKKLTGAVCLENSIELGWAHIFFLVNKPIMGILDSRLVQHICCSHFMYCQHGCSTLVSVPMPFHILQCFQLFIVSSWLPSFIFRFIASPFEFLSTRFCNLSCVELEIL